MDRGSIPLDALRGGFDLQSTIESGQTYRWERLDGDTYREPGARGGADWYATVEDGEALEVRQVEDRIEWVATTDAAEILRERLRLSDDLPAIVEASPDDPLVQRAYAAFPGMRLVEDPFFPCLISFICSAQMRVDRIFAMVTALRETYGEPVNLDGRTYHGFPSAERLAASTESELRDLGLGYRAPYVVATAEMIADETFDVADVRDLPYEEAREALTALVGVGPKVADCVCLFSLGHLDAVPLDTWIRSAIDEHYPDCARGEYASTSRAIRERFGPYPGYAQTYVFHYLRTRDI